MARVLFWRVLAFFLARYELIAPHGVPYLSRWHFPQWLARLHGAEYLFLHRFHRGDEGRGWHNHPYAWCEATVLAGYYWQEVQRESAPMALGYDANRSMMWLPREFFVSRRFYGLGDMNRLTNEFHALRLSPGVRTWTLFRAGAKHGRSWGFRDAEGNFTPANGEAS